MRVAINPCCTIAKWFSASVSRLQSDNKQCWIVYTSEEFFSKAASAATEPSWTTATRALWMMDNNWKDVAMGWVIPGMVGNLTAMLHRAAMPSSWMIRWEFAGSEDKREIVSPMQRRMIGSVSAESICAAWTALRDTISTRHDLDWDRFCKITAQIRLVLVSDPLARMLNTDMTPSSTSRNRTVFISAKLHRAAAHMCLTLVVVEPPASWIRARTTFSMNKYELSTQVKLYNPLAQDADSSGCEVKIFVNAWWIIASTTCPSRPFTRVKLTNVMVRLPTTLSSLIPALMISAMTGIVDSSIIVVANTKFSDMNLNAPAQ